MARAYFPVLMLLGFVAINAVLMVAASTLLLRSRPTPVKQQAYESGVPALGDARERFSVRFYWWRSCSSSSTSKPSSYSMGGYYKQCPASCPVTAVCRSADLFSVWRELVFHGILSSGVYHVEKEAAVGLSAPVIAEPFHTSRVQDGWVATRLDLVNWGRAIAWPSRSGRRAAP